MLIPGVLATLVLGLLVWFWIRRNRRGSLTADGKHVLITGCDSGFGKRTAIRLDQLGFHVFATCLTKEGEEGLKDVCSERLNTLHLDVTSSEEIENVCKEVTKLLPRNKGLWGLINNAGVLAFGPVEWLPLAAYKKAADVNVWGVIAVTKAFLPLVKKEKGRVVNNASIAGRISLRLFSPYSISKYAIEAFSDALRREMVPWGVGVSIIEAGAHKTPILVPSVLETGVRNLWENLSNDQQEEYGEEYLQKTIKGFRAWGDSADPQVHHVVDGIIEALTSQNPKTRYVIGLDAWLIVWILRVCPDTVQDWILLFLVKV